MLIELQGLPVSTNASLMAQGNRLIHTSAARNYRKKAEQAIQNQLEQHLRINPELENELEAMVNEPLFCEIRLFSNWITQKATIRKTDLANREKLCLDSLISVLNSNGYKIDDSQVYLLLMSKHDNKGYEDKTQITLKLLKAFNTDPIDPTDQDDN